MDKKTVFFGVLLIVAIFAILFMFIKDNFFDIQSGNQEILKNSITIEQLNQHALEDDCWVGFQGKVYDLTSWLPNHPGKAEAILPYCGTAEEFEQAFAKKHGTAKVSLFMKVALFMGDLELKGNLN